ncbi:MAG: penicillin-binding protein, partial [Bacteroidota bacterium]
MQKLNRWFKELKRWKKIILFGSLFFLIWYVFALPKILFKDKYTTVLLDRNGEFLGAKISDDGQWRFPECDSVPKKLEICLLQFEDKTFYHHVGISAKGITRAAIQNCKRKKIVSGASTITMQTIRLMRKNPPRTFAEKMYEMILATRLEFGYSKKEILRLYVSHAPFGNNVVGLNAASWRYFGKNAEKLSWAECATLAVLPNAPGLIYPGKNHQRLLLKRNRLLANLWQQKIIDTSIYQLSMAEPLPQKPLPLPQFAPHLLQKLIKLGWKGKTINSTIDLQIQQQAISILKTHSEALQDNKIYNGAMVITSVKSGEVLAYVGNTNDDKEHANDVNCMDAPRSTGSILKPILYEKCLEEGLITPLSLIPDIPIQYGTFSPKNYNKTYDGAVPANEALARSLNIPLIKLLNDYGLSKFHHDLKKMGLHGLNKSSNYYGLSLILGGAEISLWNLNNIYSQMAMSANNISVHSIQLIKESNKKSETFYMDRACIYSTLNAMTELNRPDEEG